MQELVLNPNMEYAPKDPAVGVGAGLKAAHTRTVQWLRSPQRHHTRNVGVPHPFGVQESPLEFDPTFYPYLSKPFLDHMAPAKNIAVHGIALVEVQRVQY